jgi:rhodanese-related sulfurtransferase
MAIFLTSLSDDDTTPGERRFAKALKRCLSDEYLVWHDVPVGSNRCGDSHRQPDFIVMHPQQGITVIEVKDWHIGTIQSLDPQSATLLVDGQVKGAKSPLAQARNYSLKVKNLLERDPALIHGNGIHHGKLVIPCNYGVVFANIKRETFEKNIFSSVIPSHWVICKDEMTEAVMPEDFKNRFLGLRQFKFQTTLTSEQVDRIRYHLFPEIRILSPVVDDEIPDVIQVMDLNQEKLARNLGDGHRIIQGVAGSGKTLILINRCIQLSEDVKDKILVICYNVVLASKLRHILQEQGIGNKVIVQHFHGWCKYILQEYRISRPKWGDNYIAELENTVLQSVADGKIPQGIYGAVLIDEANDFESAWLELLAKMPHPSKKHLIVHDNAQNLYPERQKPTWSRIGIQARGRSHILNINYRNTFEVANWARRFASDMFIETGEIDEDTPQTIVPKIAGHSGIAPKLKSKSGFRAELEYLANGIKGLHTDGRPWQEIAILYAFKWQGEKIANILAAHEVPVSWLKEQEERLGFDPAHSSVKLMPIKSSKGLEFPVVCIPGIGGMAEYHERVQVLYVGMTRSTNKLVLTYEDRDQSSTLVQKLLAALPETAQVIDFPPQKEAISA